MNISFEIPHDIEQQIHAEGADLSGKAREAFLLELYREGRISHAQLREALSLSFHEAERLIKERTAGQDVDPAEFAASRERSRKARPE